MVLRRIVRSEAALGFAASAIGLYLDFALRTTRWRLDADASRMRALTQTPAIFAFWHDCLPMIPMLGRALHEAAPQHASPPASHVLISRHRDGQLISRIVARFSAITVAGSSGREKHGQRSERGGAVAFRRMLVLLRDGQHVGITPDGPRGPSRSAQPGCTRLAAMSGVPITPCAAAMRPALRLPSWDRMMLPLPFGRGVLVVGAPVTVGRHDAQACLPVLGAALDAASRRAVDALAATS